MKTASMTPTVEECAVRTDELNLAAVITQSFKVIAPSWSLKNLIATNPLQGLEDLPIEDALKMGAAYFQQQSLPQPMIAVNRETIKWLQAYCDDGQATITMPLRRQGLYAAWRQLARYDRRLHGHAQDKQQWLRTLAEKPEQAIEKCLLSLNIPPEQYQSFLTLVLTTLPGWAAYIKYRTEWAGLDAEHPYPLTQADYLAVRVVITTLLWPQAKVLLAWHRQAVVNCAANPSSLQTLQKAENAYRMPLLKQLAAQPLQAPHIPEAQWVFCIDVRSEPFRRALEATADYQTFGFAGFFGIPIQVTDPVAGTTYASCPVLLTPKHEVCETPCTPAAHAHYQKGYQRLSLLKRLYQSVKYAFITPFVLVEGLGLLSGLWMACRTLAPQMASTLKAYVLQAISKPQVLEPSLDNIPLAEQCVYAEQALRMMGLTRHFAPVVVLCGHGSMTQNNAYATALDCGACGGRHGASNARVLAAIFNRAEVRAQLAENGIMIPQTTRFIAAEHTTTTDEVTFYNCPDDDLIQKLQANLAKARSANNWLRLQQLEENPAVATAVTQTWLRAHDWAQVRPEWGLARNAAFIVAPRDISASVNLHGRCFLHSYDYSQDVNGTALTVILTAPMVVAEWINTQYLFSTLDNVAYGGGSKITKNITGKIGIMQGNASDLMTGLPLQSVYRNDREPYHELQRLMTVVYAPPSLLTSIIQAQPVLQKLFANGWVQLVCIEPTTRKIYFLGRDLTWQHQD